MKNKYDVIIIGAGIGGLVCGCYIAKKGLKVLIVEQNNIPGGYCTSFKRNGFLFDMGIHSLSGCRAGGHLDKVFKDLAIDKEIVLIRPNPIELVVSANVEVFFETNVNKTIENLSANFPKEKENIKKFFKFIKATSPSQLFIVLKNLSAKKMLDHFFDNTALKSLLGVLALNLAMPPSKMPAIAMAIIFRETVLDGGYYPKGGMIRLAMAYSQKFKEYGGDLILSKKVKKIIVKNQRAVKAIELEGDTKIEAGWIVANCDIRQTYFDLIGKNLISSKLINQLNTMVPSVSAFMVFLGIKGSVGERFKNCGYVWYFPNDNYEKVLAKAMKGKVDFNDNNFIMASPTFRDGSLAPVGCESLYFTVFVPYCSKKFWLNNMAKMEINILNRIKNLFPNIEKQIIFRETATPVTLHECTLNHRGAVLGWASNIKQVESLRVAQRSPYENLIFAGHWTSSLGGYGGVRHATYSGSIAANIILDSFDR